MFTFKPLSNINFSVSLFYKFCLNSFSSPDNVTIRVYECPKNWPNYKTCIRLQFSISLWDQDYDPEVDFDLSEFDYELSTASLSIMWDLYGKYDFLDVLGIEVCKTNKIYR